MTRRFRVLRVAKQPSRSLARDVGSPGVREVGTGAGPALKFENNNIQPHPLGVLQMIAPGNILVPR